MYRIQLRETDPEGREILTPRSGVDYPTIRQATRAAKEEAYVQTAELQRPVAVRVVQGNEGRPIIRFVMPALPLEDQRALFGPPRVSAALALYA